MITGELKNKIDSIWEIFWTGGLTNPLDVIEQMTYMMFIHDLDDSDNLRAKEAAMLGLPYQSIFAEEVQIGDRTIAGNQLKWSIFHDFPAAKMYSVVQEWVFPFIKNLHGDKDSAYAKYMGDAIFKIPTPLMLDKIVTSMDTLYAQMAQVKSSDIRGDVYEYLLSKLSTAGVNGQFRTPRHIIRMMVDLMEPAPDEVICDPACGTSGFLVAASEYLKENRKEEVFFNRQNKNHYMNHMFHGFDMDRTMLRIGAMNMMTHGVDNPFIEYRDSLSDQNPDREKYSLCLANPPFKGSLDYDSVSTDLLKVCKTKKTELLFLALFVRMLKVGGRCACIVPDGVLFGSSTAHKAIRKELIENQRLHMAGSTGTGVGHLHRIGLGLNISKQLINRIILGVAVHNNHFGIVGHQRDGIKIRIAHLADVHDCCKQSGSACFEGRVSGKSLYPVDDLLFTSALKDGHIVQFFVICHITAELHTAEEEFEYLTVYIIYFVAKLLNFHKIPPEK